MHNPLKARLQSGEPTYGVLVTLGSPELTELLCTLDLDWLWVDLEHSAIELETAQTLMQIMQFGAVTPVVRVPWNEPAMVKRVLDIGAYGVIFPMVSTAGEAEAAVQACKYPPRGIRGCGGARAQRLGLDGAEYRATANDETLVIVQCETAEAVANIADIAATPDVDVVFIGPYDLSMSLGLPGQFDHPEFCAAVDRVLAACKAAGKVAGFFAITAQDAGRRAEQGFGWIAIGVDATIYAQAAVDFVQSAVRR